MPTPRLLSTFDDPGGRFGRRKVVVDAEGRFTVVGRDPDGGLWSWSLPDGDFVEHPRTGLDPAGPDTTAHAAARFEDRTVVLTGSAFHDSGDGVPGSMVDLWDLESGERRAGPLVIEYGGDIEAVTVRAHGDRLIGLAGTENCDAIVWDLMSGERVGGLSETIGESVDAVALAEVDGDLVGIAGSLDHHVWIWGAHGDTDTGFWPLPCGPDSVAVCEWRGRPVVVAAGGFPEVRLWDLRDRKEIDHRLSCDDEVFTASVLPYGERVFVLTDADHAEPDYTVRLFDLDTGEVIHPEVTEGSRSGVLGVHGGRPVVVLSGDDGRIRAWDLGSGT